MSDLAEDLVVPQAYRRHNNRTVGLIYAIMDWVLPIATIQVGTYLPQQGVIGFINRQLILLFVKWPITHYLPCYRLLVRLQVGIYIRYGREMK